MFGQAKKRLAWNLLFSHGRLDFVQIFPCSEAEEPLLKQLWFKGVAGLAMSNRVVPCQSSYRSCLRSLSSRGMRAFMLKGFPSSRLALQPAVRLQMCEDANAIFPFGQVSELDFFIKKQFFLPYNLTTCFTLKHMS